jgi:Transglycosylase SLT domain
VRVRASGRVRKWSSLGALVLALLYVPPALAAEDGESLVASVCRIIESSAVAKHLPVAFLTGLIWQESNFRSDVVSPVGARGIAQFMPAVAAERGLANPNDPEAAIPKAAELLADLKQRFGNLGLAAAAYNAGATRVATWLAGAGELPLETRDYVRIVTRHPVEEWSGLGAANLTDDAVFPDSSCVQRIAAVSRGEPAASVNSAVWTLWGVQISSGFSKGAAMWNEYAGAMNAYLSNFYSAYISSQLRLDILVPAAMIIFAIAYIGRPLKNIRDELRRSKIQLEAVLRSGAIDLTRPNVSKPALAADGREFLRAEPGERLLDRPEPRAWPGLPSVDPRNLFAALDRKGAAKPQDEESAHAPLAPGSSASTDPPNAASDPIAEEKPATWVPEAPLAALAFRLPFPRAEKAKTRPWKLVSIGICLALFAISGALALPDSLLGLTMSAAKNQAIAGLATVADDLKTPLDAITGSSRREEERAAMRDLSAKLTQMTVRLDQIEHDYGARLDKLGERIDQDSSSRFAEVSARLDKLEQKAAAPAPPAAQLTDIATRLDKLEKSAALAAQPIAQLTDIATRLDKLEKRAAIPATPSSEGAEAGSRPDKGEKKAALAPAASPAAPLPPSTPKQSTLMARAEPVPSSERARPDNEDNPRPLLRNYNIEYVQGGMAVVDGRYGSQQVAPGDMIPGAGHVLRIEKRGGNWVIVTTLGVISGPAPR